MPERLTVSNTSCLIGLQTIGKLNLLQQLYGRLTLPPEVVTEWGVELPEWVTVQAAHDQVLVESLRSDLGKGESAAIVLAAELSAQRLILATERRESWPNVWICK